MDFNPFILEIDVISVGVVQRQDALAGLVNRHVVGGVADFHLDGCFSTVISHYRRVFLLCFSDLVL